MGSEKHKARLDLSDDSGFWLRVKTEDAAPFITAFKTSPVFHEFVIEQRLGKETRSSTLNARIVKIEEGPSELRVLIRPDIPVPLIFQD
jgi:hypothetical protein